MADVLMKWGDFGFSIDRAAYNELTKKWQWNWAAQARIGQSDALQCTGKAADTISLSGRVAATFLGVGINQIQAIADLGNEMEPKLMVSGLGNVMGYWVLRSLTETGNRFVKGGAPRQQTFSAEFAYYGDSL